MINIRKTSKYNRQRDEFIKHNIKAGKALVKTLKLFRENPNHPSLNLEKLRGSDYWTIRIDQGSRIFFMWIDSETALFMDIGKHDKYREY